MPINYASVNQEYEKNPKLKKEDVQYLQEWLKKQPHLPKIHEFEIIYFLRSCNYGVERTKITIDNHYTLKRLSPEIFGQRNLKTLEETFNNTVLVPMPKLSRDGYQAFYTKLKSKGVENYNFFDSVYCAHIILRISLLQKETVNGLVYIYDWEGFSLAHVTQIPFMGLKKLITFLQEGLPLKLQQFHFINTNIYLDRFIAIIKPLLKIKLTDQVHMHSDYTKTLYQYVNPECLPKELGGEDNSISKLQDQVKALVFANEDFMEEDAKLVTDESKRPQKSNKFDQLFGIEGTFKKLELD